GVGGSTAASSDTDVFQNDTDLVFHAGLGARVALGPSWGLRLDARLALPPSSDSESVTADGEILVALWKSFGPPAPPPPPPGQPCPPSSDPADPRDGIEPVAEKPPAPPPQPSDGDGDGLLDDKDRCAKEPETANGFDDADGCPDEVPADVKKLTGVISGIQFVQSTAELAPGSAAVLDETVAMLTKYPTVRIEISGHTDSSGDEQKNRALSQQRADAVRAYLVKRGIAEARLESKGYGPEFPIGNNATPDGRAQNRRVEFKLLSP
ncbi:MAG TPA: OmpA family protein, partial [Kofleriaceae bacterium]|nr:OmpA family protein [Kofleriaceae bacterium]